MHYYIVRISHLLLENVRSITRT